MATPVVQLRVPEPVLAAVDEARGDESRSTWILGAIGLRLSPLPEAAAAAVEDPEALGPVIPVAVVTPGRHRAGQPCRHPKARVHKGLCHECGTGGLG